MLSGPYFIFIYFTTRVSHIATSRVCLRAELQATVLLVPEDVLCRDDGQREQRNGGHAAAQAQADWLLGPQSQPCGEGGNRRQVHPLKAPRRRLESLKWS